VDITSDTTSSKFVVEWDAANFGESILFTTDILLSCNDAEVAIVTGLDKSVISYEIVYSAIKSLASKGVNEGGLGIAADTATDVKLRLSSKVGSTGTVLYSDYATFKLKYAN